MLSSYVLAEVATMSGYDATSVLVALSPRIKSGMAWQARPNSRIHNLFLFQLQRI